MNIDGGGDSQVEMKLMGEFQEEKIETATEVKKEKSSVNIVKLSYFLFYCARGALEPYIAVFMSRRGYSVSQVSTLMSVFTVVMAIGTPLLSYMADKYHIHSRLHVISLVGSFLVSPFIGILAEDEPVSLTPVNHEDPEMRWPMVAIIIFGLFRSPIEPLLDSAALTALSHAHAENLYGSLRMYGSVGYMAGGFISSTLTDGFGASVPFVWYMFFTGFAAIVAKILYSKLSSWSPSDSHSSSKPVGIAFGRSMIKDVCRITFENWHFFCVVLLAGMSHAVVNVMVPLFLRKTLQAPGFVTGLSLVIAGISEIPMFMFGRQAVVRLTGGKLQCIVISLLCAILRMMFYSLAAYFGDLGAPNVGMFFCCVVSMLHGFTFSLFWTACVDTCDSIAPPLLKATFQGILSALYNGLAAALGSLLGGLVYDAYSPNVVFEFFAIVNFLAICLFALSNSKTSA